MDVSGMLNNTADVFTLSTSQDGIGGVSESYASNPRLKAVPCRVRALRGDEVPTLGTDRENSTHRIYFKAGITINETDRVTIKGRNYRVTFPDDVDQQEDLLQVNAERLV